LQNATPFSGFANLLGILGGFVHFPADDRLRHVVEMGRGSERGATYLWRRMTLWRGMTAEPFKQWDSETVRKWLECRAIAARADQAAAERSGRSGQDDCDKATAEEMVCALLKGNAATNLQSSFHDELKSLLERDEYVFRGVYDDTRFDRHVRTYLRKLIKMTKINTGFENISRYQ